MIEIEFFLSKALCDEFTTSNRVDAYLTVPVRIGTGKKGDW